MKSTPLLASALLLASGLTPAAPDPAAAPGTTGAPAASETAPAQGKPAGRHGYGAGESAGVGITMHAVDASGNGAALGRIVFKATPHGIVFTPALSGLTPGLHGFHLHENPSCAPGEKDGKPVAALAAGGHYDPEKTGRHGAPWGDGHLGDLPPLYVDADGRATQPVLAPRLKRGDLSGRALMVHAGGDNHADHPAPLGGGGARVACGVIP